MGESLALIVVGLVMLYGGAEALVKGASVLALFLGLTPLVIGLTVVAYGTSLPELAVSITAARENSGGMAIGNVVGSNICNIGIVLGFAAVCRPLVVTRETTRIYVPFMLVAAGLVTCFLVDGLLDRIEGFALVGGIIAYTTYGIRRARRQTKAADEVEGQPSIRNPQPRLAKPAFLIGIGFIILLVGGKFLVTGAVALAQRMQVDEAVIALTVVALGTSAPDLAASAVAARRGQGEMAAGNAIGSVIFNLLNVLGIAALVRPIEAIGINIIDIAVQMAFLLLAGLLLGRGLVMGRWQGLLCIGGYIAYLVYRWPTPGI
jgi:cation:H+ antiporter